MTEYALVAQKAAVEAGTFLSGNSKELEIHEKGSAFDFVTDADIESQRIIRSVIEGAFPGHLFIGEEDGLSDKEISDALYGDMDSFFWIADPLDGTQNYIRHIGGYSVSISLFHRGEIIAGCTFVPSEDEFFIAERGGGAFLNGRRLRVSSESRISASFLNSGIPTVDFGMRSRMIRILGSLAAVSLNMRIIGSAARSLCLTAAGDFETYFELGPHPWDVGAGLLLVEEAGGRVSDFSGRPYRFGAEGIVATNGHIHEELLSYLREL